jgi:hypothetical protein
MKYVINKDADGIETIVLDNLDGSVSYIPSDPANSDYQAYLESLEPKDTKVVDEAAPE